MLDRWRNVGNAAELVQRVQLALAHLETERKTLDRQTELLEVEKLEARSLKEKAEESRKRLQLTLEEVKWQKHELAQERSAFDRKRGHLSALLPSLAQVLQAN